MRLRIIFVLLVSLSGYVRAQEITVVSSDQLFKKIESAKSELTILNFWATWCGPCVKELPYFEALKNRSDVQVILVSLDFLEEKDQVSKFIKKKQITQPVVLLNEKDMNAFMMNISDSWSGAIPATLFIKRSGKRYFHEGAYTSEALNQTIDTYILNE